MRVRVMCKLCVACVVCRAESTIQYSPQVQSPPPPQHKARVRCWSVRVSPVRLPRAGDSTASNPKSENRETRRLGLLRNYIKGLT